MCVEGSLSAEHALSAAGLRLSSALTVSRWESLSVLFRVMLVTALLFLASYSQSGFLNRSDVSVSQHSCTISPPLYDTEGPF